MATHRTLVSGGQVLSMDPALGVLPSADVLIEDGEIVYVGPPIDATVDAERIDATGHLVAPGLIDTHRHTWQTQLRAICGDWVLSDYFQGVRLALSPSYTPDDVRIGQRLGALEALDAGVTTLLDFSHCNNSPDHSDAAVEGLRAAGGRAVWGYGFFESSPFAPTHFTDHGQRVEDLARVAKTHFSSSDQLITLGVALTEPGLVPFTHTAAEIRAAREHDALIVTHMGCVWSMPNGLHEMAAAGLLGPDMVHVHCNTLTDEEWRLVADSGGKVSISPETEINMGMGRPAFGKCAEFGVKPTLSCDVVSLNSGDILTQMRFGLGLKRWADTEHLNARAENPTTISTTSLQALEWGTTNGADAIGLGDRLGRLAPGHRADLIIVGGDTVATHPVLDPAGALVFQTRPSDIRTVLVDGRVVKRDGALVGVDLPGLLAEADASAAGVVERALQRVPVLPPPNPGGFDQVLALAVANMGA
jgi:cytosine/adenosine deaminase-related metal-dependent hydrolase